MIEIINNKHGVGFNMLGSSFAVTPYNYRNLQKINFVGKSKSDNAGGGENSFPFQNPIKPKSKRDLGVVSGISLSSVDTFNKKAYKMGKTNDELFKKLLGSDAYIPPVLPVDSKSAIVGSTRVTTLIDGGQIFDKTLEYLRSAEKSIQVEMFEFQNLTVDGDKWVQNGAEKVPGAKEQQQILWMLIKKKQANPNMKIQVILDAHKWYIDGRGNKIRHYGNQDMIKFLKQKGIDVVPYPRSSQGGSALQHVKLLAVDGKKAIVGGMNWGTHSAANHDACVAIETLPNKKNSEVDNLIEQNFNTDWKFSWQRLGETDLAAGPLSEDEQQFYRGKNKKINQENVDYVNLLKDFYDTPEAKNRYNDGELNLIATNPVDAPKIRVLGTKPKELEKVGKEGTESTREYLMDKVRTCSKMRAELFVLTDKELIQTVIKRVKNGELDAQFIITSDILEEFPYCRKPYNELIKNNIPVRLYNSDDSINQRLHSKWAVFDDNEVMIGSTNWSAMGLNQKIRLGKRADYELNSAKIDEQIKEYLKIVKKFEKDFAMPSLTWDGSNAAYEKLKERCTIFNKALRELNKEGSTTINLDGKEFTYKDDGSDDKSNIQTMLGYYDMIKEEHNSKERFKRGNNEITVAFESPSLAKNVFVKQFIRDWNYSESEYDKLKNKEWPMAKPTAVATADESE